jgi:hypothetical protein
VQQLLQLDIKEWRPCSKPYRRPSERERGRAGTHQQAATEQATAQVRAAQALLDLAAAQAVMEAAATGGGVETCPLSPALASNLLLLDYRTGAGIKIYGKATAPLDVLFDGDSGGLRLFLSKAKQRATQFGWLEIIQINQAAQVYN